MDAIAIRLLFLVAEQTFTYTLRLVMSTLKQGCTNENPEHVGQYSVLLQRAIVYNDNIVIEVCTVRKPTFQINP